nr:hypothetical protein GCM10025730_26460 [Promicromonospora thailandica]
MAGDQERAPLGGEPAEHRPQVAPQHRVQTHRGLVEHEQLRVADQGRGQRDPGPFAPGQRADPLPLVPTRSTVATAAATARAGDGTPASAAKYRRFWTTVRSV